MLFNPVTSAAWKPRPQHAQRMLQQEQGPEPSGRRGRAGRSRPWQGWVLLVGPSDRRVQPGQRRGSSRRVLHGSKPRTVIRFGGAGLGKLRALPPPALPHAQAPTLPSFILQKWKCPSNMKRLLGEENPAQHFLAFVHGFSSSKLLANIS